MIRVRKTLDWLNESVVPRRRRWQLILSLLRDSIRDSVIQNQIREMQHRIEEAQQHIADLEKRIG